jgi:hypothetical protein
LFLGIYSIGCSVTRKAGNKKLPEFNEAVSGSILERIKKQNITDASFFIQKAEIELIAGSEKKRFLGSIKFEYPDRFLFSLKSKTGIEGARIYVNKDSVLVNDRINKKMYFGTALNLKRKFGLNQSVIPLIFGDMIFDNKFNTETLKCENNKLRVDYTYRGIPMHYNIDCKKSKVEQISLGNSDLKDNIDIDYSSFIFLNNMILPRIIEIVDMQYNIKIRIKIIKTEYPWNGNVKFVPGKGYEIIEIL